MKFREMVHIGPGHIARNNNNDEHNCSAQFKQSSNQGSCAGLEFKASLEKSLNFIKLKMSNRFGKRVEGLEKFGICLCETFNKTW